jgi:hypothetical protein
MNVPPGYFPQEYSSTYSKYVLLSQADPSEPSYDVLHLNLWSSPTSCVRDVRFRSSGIHAVCRKLTADYQLLNHHVPHMRANDYLKTEEKFETVPFTETTTQ